LSNARGPGGSLIVALGALTTAVGIGSTATSLLARVSLVATRASVPTALGLGLGYLLDELDEKLGGHTFNAVGRWSMFSPLEWQNYDPNNSPVAHGKIVRPPVTPTAPRPSGDAAASKPTAMNGVGTNITFENVTVNSRGQDGAALARDFTNSVRRSLNVASADAGMVS
jgi:hypothetical protein